MRIISDINELRSQMHGQNRVAFVPTMGNLHEGHLALVTEARRHSEAVIVSIFVNRLQFGQGEDFDSYPRTFEADCAKLEAAQVDALFLPDERALYPRIRQDFNVEPPHLQNELCGAFRPGHFRGVATVVTKLFNIVQPDVACFGKKDYQQLAIIRQMVSELNFPIEIIGAEIVRADDGLALSSRNQYLSKTERNIAPQIQQAVQSLKAEIQQANFSEFENLVEKTKHTLNSNGFNVDYLELHNQNLQPVTPSDKSLVLITAVWLGKARLLDNLEVMLNWK